MKNEQPTGRILFYRFLAGSLVLLFVLSLLSSSMPFFIYLPLEQLIEGTSTLRENSSFLDSYEPLIISSNQNFVQQGWPGNGTKNNPYVIEDIEISSPTVCISISSTTAYFEIRNCIFSAPIESQLHGTGIQLESVIHGIIKNCTMTHLSVGIYDRNGNSNLHENNSFKDVFEGIAVSHGESITIINNTVTGARSQYGIVLFGVRSCSIVNNYLSDITVLSSLNCTFVGNQLWQAGFSFFNTAPAQWYHIMQDNFVRGKRVGYFRDQHNLFIDARLFSQMFLINCTNTMAFGGHFSGLQIGVTVYDSLNCTLRDITVEHNYFEGIHIERSSSCILQDNVVRQNQYTGIYIIASDKIILKNQSISANVGIAGIEAVSATYITLEQSYIINNSKGIDFYETINCSIIGNMIFNNELGISLIRSNSCQISNNAFERNLTGIQLLSGSVENQIYWNIFSYNNVNAKDDGYSNRWDDGFSRGNFWSDYVGLGYYLIPGNGNGIDKFPMLIFSLETVSFLFWFYLPVFLLSFAIVILFYLVFLIREHFQLNMKNTFYSK